MLNFLKPLRIFNAMLLELFLAIAAVLETLRIYFLAGEMRTLALEKNEDPGKWISYTILLWILLELLVIFIWYVNFGWNLSLVGGVVVAILCARVVFHFLRRNLENKDNKGIEDKIDQIGDATEN